MSFSFEDALRPFPKETRLYDNCIFPKGWTRLMAELFLYRTDATKGGALGRAAHFKHVTQILFGTDNPGGMTFLWHPWADMMNEASAITNYLAIAGGGSSGKTDYLGVKAIVEYLCDPDRTKVIVTSVSLKGSRERIWGRLTSYWQSLGPRFPGQLHSSGILRHPTMKETRGISLIAGDPSKEREATSKFQGVKAERVVLIADELPELSPAVLTAGLGNLPIGKEYFLMIGAGNPASYFDPFGALAQPIGGWDTIHAEMNNWKTRYGLAIRLDGEKSPNILAGKTLYPFLPKQEDVEDQKRIHGENSTTYWKMTRGFWSPTGADESIYTEQEVTVKFGASKKCEWQSPPTPVAAVDPAFTSGGDRAIYFKGSVGTSMEGRRVLQFDKYEVLKDDVTNVKEPRNFQIARQFVDCCRRDGVAPRCAVADNTGGGALFADIVAYLWGTNDFLRCDFGGQASERSMSMTNMEKASDLCANRVTEIWLRGVELLRTEQLRGITPDLAKELTARRYDQSSKRGSGKMKVESKRDMKSRVGFSCDIADAALMLCALSCERLGFATVKLPGTSKFSFDKSKTWKARAERLNPSVGRRVNLTSLSRY